MGGSKAGGTKDNKGKARVSTFKLWLTLLVELEQMLTGLITG